MTFTVGRVSFTDCPVSVVQDGDSLTVSFNLIASDVDQLAALRQQVSGLVGDVDDETVPVTSSDDPHLDGFYIVRSASLPGDQMMLAGKLIMGGSLFLERIPGHSAPVIELDASAVVRTNSVGATSTEPSSLSTVTHESASTYDTSTGTPFGRTGEDGDMYCVKQAAPFSRVTQVFPSIANRYAGACRVEVQFGSTWYPMVGQQVPDSAAGNWRISNGLVRFTYATYTGTADTVGGLLVEAYDAGAWRETVTMKLGTWDGAAFTDAAWSGDGIGSTQDPTGDVVACPLRVLRNSPETVTVGFYKQQSATQFLSLDQGAMFCTLTTRGPGTVQPFLRPVGSETGAGLGTGSIWSYDPGLQRSSNDTNGNRYCILYVASGSWFNQNGGIRHGANVSAFTAVTFGIGVVLDGSSAATGNTGLELAEQFVGQAAWRQRVVVR
jgi:hypothetical protein